MRVPGSRVAMIAAPAVGLARTKDGPTTRKFALFADFSSLSPRGGRSAFFDLSADDRS
jgi:hypothetical protein